jgi:hypothetical protein
MTSCTQCCSYNASSELDSHPDCIMELCEDLNNNFKIIRGTYCLHLKHNRYVPLRKENDDHEKSIVSRWDCTCNNHS